MLIKITFNRSFEWFSDGDHDIGAENPEDVVEKEASEKDAAGHNIIQMKQLNAIHGESESEQIISDPVLFFKYK